MQYFVLRSGLQPGQAFTELLAYELMNCMYEPE